MISKKAKYAVNALVYLAKRYQEGPILISEIAGNEHIPRKFLEVILLQLRNAGMLASKKGKGGGYYLLKSPEEINVADVLRLMDGAIALLPCASDNYYQPCDECRDVKVCGIRALFREVRDETVRLLRENTLSDIIKREGQLKEKDSPLLP